MKCVRAELGSSRPNGHRVGAGKPKIPAERAATTQHDARRTRVLVGAGNGFAAAGAASDRSSAEVPWRRRRTAGTPLQALLCGGWPAHWKGRAKTKVARGDPGEE